MPGGKGETREAAVMKRALAAMPSGGKPSQEPEELLDDANGDRGDVADPATHMPRAMGSRCLACGKDLSVRDAQFGGYCADCHQGEDDVERPGGGVTSPKGVRPHPQGVADGTNQPPLNRITARGVPRKMGGPGSGPHPGGYHVVNNGKTVAKHDTLKAAKGHAAKIGEARGYHGATHVRDTSSGTTYHNVVLPSNQGMTWVSVPPK